jgi:nitrate reductase molybdenum cofactor assembly chaperone NarJ/NarW
MIKTYKILSILLSYPEKEIREFLSEVLPNLTSEELLKEREIDGIRQFIEFYAVQELTDWQEHYVQLFDYSRAVSLYLFEHVHGDSKDRGQAMVDMINFYKENGLEINQTGLPDYLPAFLEFLSFQEPLKAAELLAEPVDILEHILNRLKVTGNLYQHILSAIISLSAREPNHELMENTSKEVLSIDFDKDYEEPQVSFGGDACSNI